jgi:hypothetical protein
MVGGVVAHPAALHSSPSALFTIARTIGGFLFLLWEKAIVMLGQMSYTESK